jgi:hypothetical protein
MMQAFPVNNIAQPEQGMTLRDYFAAKAMPSLIKTLENHITTPNDVAKLSYQYADAMMRERNAT